MSEYTPETLRAQVTVRGSLCQFTGSPWSVLDHADAWEALEKRLEEIARWADYCAVDCESGVIETEADPEVGGLLPRAKHDERFAKDFRRIEAIAKGAAALAQEKPDER